MANFIALKAARDHRAGWSVRTDGLAGGPQLALYMSTETHVVSERAGDMLGIGTRGVRKIPVDDGWRIRMDLLREQLQRDRDEGIRPFAVVASAT